MIFDFEVMLKTVSDVLQQRFMGIYGSIDGARWDHEKKCLNDSLPKVPFGIAPTSLATEYIQSEYQHDCPVYSVSCPISLNAKDRHGMKGVERLTQLDDMHSVLMNIQYIFLPHLFFFYIFIHKTFPSHQSCNPLILLLLISQRHIQL